MIVTAVKSEWLVILNFKVRMLLKGAVITCIMKFGELLLSIEFLQESRCLTVTNFPVKNIITI